MFADDSNLSFVLPNNIIPEYTCIMRGLLKSNKITIYLTIYPILACRSQLCVCNWAIYALFKIHCSKMLDIIEAASSLFGNQY